MAMTEVLTISASDLEQEIQARVHGEMEATLLYVLARQADACRAPVVVRFDFPRGDTGGLEMRFRRMGWMSRVLWWLGFGGKAVRL